MAKKPQKTRQQRRVSRTRQKLVEAASSLFAEKGLDLTTIDDITERADVGKGTFYYHFKNKEGLIKILINNVLGELREAITRKAEGITDLSELMDTLIGVHIEFFSSRWEDFVLYYQGRADLKLKEGYAVLEEPFLDYLETIESLLGSAIKSRLPKPVCHRVACATAGFVSGYYSFAVITSEDEDVDATFRSLRGALVASLTRFVSEALLQDKNG
jgi:AcrR family transcriptional regulator